MKRTILIFISVLIVFSGGWLSCKKKLNGSLLFEKVILGGCETQYDLDDQTRGGGDPIVIISVSEEFINIFVKHYYICKLVPFEARVEATKDNIIYMYIIDTCDDILEPSGCYERCYCEYTVDFVFKYEESINQKYKILLLDPRQDNPIIISEGVITI